MDQHGRRYCLQEHVTLSSQTTIGLGGEAEYFVACKSVDEIRAAVADAKLHSLRVQILGGGSNLIFKDAGFDGLVLQVASRGIVWTDEGDTVLASVQAGELWDEFARSCAERGCSGVECLSGIPGSVGASPVQNVGAYGQEVKDTIVSVSALNRATGEVSIFTNAECEFGYRDSRFKSREKDLWIVTEVTYRIQKNGVPVIVYPELRRYLEETVGASGLCELSGSAMQGEPGRLNETGGLGGSCEPRGLSGLCDLSHLGEISGSTTQGMAPARILLVRNAVISLRRKKSMVVDSQDPNTRSVGSFFMNPVVEPGVFAVLKEEWEYKHKNMPVPSYSFGACVKIPAAWLIENAGFPKGYRTAGGVGISAHHSLALVNFGGTTQALLALAQEIQEKVESVFGIRLEREAVVVY